MVFTVAVEKQKIQILTSHVDASGRMWRHREGDDKSLLKVRERSYERPRQARYEVEEGERTLC
jgi:flagellar biosynthesis chaperone FliJ